MQVPIFGVEEPGRKYVERLGAYGFLRDAGGLLALVRTPMGLFLPGGGAEAGESLVAALHREILEEIGLAVVKEKLVAQAIQFHRSSYYQEYFKKVGSFYLIEVRALSPVVLQKEHELEWHPVTEAASMLSQEFQRWAVREVLLKRVP